MPITAKHLQTIDFEGRIIHLYNGDLPEDIAASDLVAIDTEATGLNFQNNRLCLVQLSFDAGQTTYLIQINQGQDTAPRLMEVLTNPNITKIFHFARFDIALLQKQFGVVTSPIYCTKIASKLSRTYTDRHGLKHLCRELLGTDISKQQQSSDWAADELSEAQLLYAAHDVFFLHGLKTKLDFMLKREQRDQAAQACFTFLPTRTQLDLWGWGEEDIFAHS